MPPKRPTASATGPAAKRARLDGWLGIKQEALPDPIVPSAEIVAQDSTFIAHAANVKSKAEAIRFQAHIRDAHAADPASHEMLAWRLLDVKTGADGTAGPDDFVVTNGHDDDGEKWGGARILKVLEKDKHIDVAIVCSRWFGGTMLGPARFEHIETVTRDAVSKLQVVVELDELRASLLVKDAYIASLAGAPTSPGKGGDPYADLDLPKAKRLVLARDKRIALLEAKAKEPAVEVTT